MSFPADPPWPSQTVAALFAVAVVLLFTWFVLGGFRRFRAILETMENAPDLKPAYAFPGGVAWMMFAAVGAFIAVHLTTDALRDVVQEGFDVWWAAGRPEEFPAPPGQGIGAAGWIGLVVVMLAVAWGLSYVLHGFQRYGSGKRAAQVGVLRLGLVSLVVLAYGGVLWWEVGRQQQAWADWIAVFPG
jgi:hypothetical protein